MNMSEKPLNNANTRESMQISLKAHILTRICTSLTGGDADEQLSEELRPAR